VRAFVRTSVVLKPGKVEVVGFASGPDSEVNQQYHLGVYFGLLPWAFAQSAFAQWAFAQSAFA
jgi:hypothetical protein